MTGHNSSCSQTIFRSNPERNYTKINNGLIDDERLALDTRMLLIKLLRRPSDWEITISNIMTTGRVGRDRIYRMLHEAEEFGYAEAQQGRVERGKFDRQRYRVSDDPAILIARAAQEIDAMLPLPEKPETVVPFPEKPEAVKRAKMAETSRFSPLPENPEADEPLTGSPLTGLPLTANPQQTNKEKELINKKDPPIVPQTGDVSALNNELWGSTSRRVAAGVTVAVGMAFGATSDPALASATNLASPSVCVQQNVFAESGARPDANDRMLAELATLTTGADGMPFRYNVAWSPVPTASEAREVEKDAPPKRTKAKVDVQEYTHDFEEFWKIYPRREGKGLAFKSWQKLSIDRKRIAYVALRKQLQVLTDRANDPVKNYCPLPATWINQCRFDDDAEQMEMAKKSQQQKKNDYSFSGEYTGSRL